MKFGCVRDHINSALRSMAPPEKILPSEYAEKNLRISEENKIPGPIRFKNAPYQVEPLDMLVNPECNKITLMWGAQLGKTTLISCGQAFFIDHDPQSQMLLFPTRDDLDVWIETKFDPMVKANDVVSQKLAAPRSRGKKAIDNRKMKSYPGGFLFFAWAGSANTQRSRSAPKIWCDEVDAYADGKEGNPVKLADKRSATFGDNRMLFRTSTPTLKDQSEIEKAFLAGDQRRFHCPCPHCGQEQTLKFKNLLWETDEEGELIKSSVKYQCENASCKGYISNSQKLAMVRKGRWIAAKKFRGHASYHLNELYSPFVRFSKIVEDYIEAVRDEDLQAFYNTSLAETYEIVGEQLDENALAARVEAYTAEAPTGVLSITMGVDVQHDRLEAEVVGWGLGVESWGLDYQVMWGDTSLDPDDELSPWYALDEYLQRTFVCGDGSVHKISTVCVDSSDQTDVVYNYCRRRAHRRVYAIKGISGWGRPIVSAPSKKKIKKTDKPCNMFPVGVDPAKLEVQSKFLKEEKGPGYCHIPNKYDKEWFLQISAEKLVKEIVKGKAKYYWKQERKRNEALDCRVYALAALYLLSPDPLRFLKRRAVLHKKKIVEPEKTPDETEKKPDKSNAHKSKVSDQKPKKVYKWRRRSPKSRANSERDRPST